MKKSTIDKIVNNASDHRTTRIGAWTYTADLWTGTIIRCKTADIGRRWIDSDGKIHDAWRTVCTI